MRFFFLLEYGMGTQFHWLRGSNQQQINIPNE